MAIELNKSISKLIGNTRNLELFLGKEVATQIALENSVCCGIGRKKLYLVDSSGTKTLAKFPLQFNAVTVNNNTEFAEEVTKFFGEGYIAYVLKAGNVIVLSSPYQKQSDGTLNIPDFLTITNL